MHDSTTWTLIHHERSSLADTLAELTDEEWERPSHCAGWSVRVTAAHLVMAAAQTTGHFLRRMVAHGFRFNRMMDHDSRSIAAAPTAELVDRLRARVTTTNRPPAPGVTMLGEIVVHGDDIRVPLGRTEEPSPDAVVACLDMYSRGGFPIGGKRRIAGLRLVATDLEWSHGDGAEVSGPARSLLLALTGRSAALDALGGDGPTCSDTAASSDPALDSR